MRVCIGRGGGRLMGWEVVVFLVVFGIGNVCFGYIWIRVKVCMRRFSIHVNSRG